MSARISAKPLILRGASVVTPEATRPLDISILDGRIVGLHQPGSTVDADPVDVTGLTIMPGAVDAHIHLGHGNDISRPRIPADASSESAAALRGGVTTFISYLLSSEPYEVIFDDVKAVTEAGSRIDFGFHFVIATEHQLSMVPRYIGEFGVPTAKLFMNIRQGEGQRLGLPGIDDGFMFRLLETLGKNGGMLCPHPENIEIGWAMTARAQAADPEGQRGLASWNEARPGFIEAEAITRAAYLAGIAGSPIYFVHTSSEAALAAARRCRMGHPGVWVETCTQYLTHDITSPVGDVGKINPPIRERHDVEALWQGIADGVIDTIATDHVHRTKAAKAGGIWKASPGCPGLDTMMPSMISEGYHQRGISLGRLAEVLSTNPARLMGLGGQKGRIAVGYDADLAFVDLDARYTVTPDTLSTDAGYSLYEGMTLTGKVVHTMSRGVFGMRDGELVDSTIGHGRYLPRRLNLANPEIDS